MSTTPISDTLTKLFEVRDARIAELESALAGALTDNSFRAASFDDERESLEAKIYTLTAQLAEKSADAARLEYLLKCEGFIGLSWNNTLTVRDIHGRLISEDKDGRKAIDAARKDQK